MAQLHVLTQEPSTSLAFSVNAIGRSFCFPAYSYTEDLSLKDGFKQGSGSHSIESSHPGLKV